VGRPSAFGGFVGGSPAGHGLEVGGEGWKSEIGKLGNKGATPWRVADHLNFRSSVPLVPSDQRIRRLHTAAAVGAPMAG
jgi:hypothetical protein